MRIYFVLYSFLVGPTRVELLSDWCWWRGDVMRRHSLSGPQHVSPPYFKPLVTTLRPQLNIKLILTICKSLCRTHFVDTGNSYWRGVVMKFLVKNGRELVRRWIKNFKLQTILTAHIVFLTFASFRQKMSPRIERGFLSCSIVKLDN